MIMSAAKYRNSNTCIHWVTLTACNMGEVWCNRISSTDCNVFFNVTWPGYSKQMWYARIPSSRSGSIVFVSRALRRRRRLTSLRWTLCNRKGFNERIFALLNLTSFSQWPYYARKLFIRWIMAPLRIIISEADFWENATSQMQITLCL